MRAPTTSGHLGDGRRRERGQGMVEFALVIPIFLFLLFALIDLGRLVYINNALSEGAREGARWGIVQGRAQTAAGRTAIGAYVVNSLAAVPNPTATVTCNDGSGNNRTVCSVNNVLVVRVSAPVTMFTPVIAQIFGTRTFGATATVTVAN